MRKLALALVLLPLAACSTFGWENSGQTVTAEQRERGVKDVATMTISNRLVATLAIAYAVLAPAAGLDVTAILSSVLVASGVLACTFTFFALGWIGGGDAKLLPVATLWLVTRRLDHALPGQVLAAIAPGVS